MVTEYIVVNDGQVVQRISVERPSSKEEYIRMVRGETPSVADQAEMQKHEEGDLYVKVGGIGTPS